MDLDVASDMKALRTSGRFDVKYSFNILESSARVMSSHGKPQLEVRESLKI